MDHTISRSEKKRQAKNIEKLTKELLSLSKNVIDKIPCEDFIKEELKDAKVLSGGSLKRQTKYITKQLRGTDVEPLLTFLEENKGSNLKKNRSFHEIEQIRDSIVNEAIEAQREKSHFNKPFDSSCWASKVLVQTAVNLPGLDCAAINVAAIKYAKTRKPTFNREIFRILKAATLQLQFQQTTDEE